jgi:hypothetical protein
MTKTVTDADGETKTVTDANGTTHFFEVYGSEPIVVSKGPPLVVLPPAAIGSAMVFVPRAVSWVEQVPMVVYYHGHNGSSSIEQYIKADKYRDFRARLAFTKAVLVAPWGGHKSKFCALGTSAGLNRLIDQAMSTAIRLGSPARAAPSPTPKGSLILAAFSGGGATMKDLVIGSTANYIHRLTEVWCIDCMYSGEGQKWLTWAKANPGRTLRVRTSTAENTNSPRVQGQLILDAVKNRPEPNIDIETPTRAGHEELPNIFVPHWLPNVDLPFAHEQPHAVDTRMQFGRRRAH